MATALDMSLMIPAGQRYPQHSPRHPAPPGAAYLQQGFEVWKLPSRIQKAWAELLQQAGTPHGYLLYLLSNTNLGHCPRSRSQLEAELQRSALCVKRALAGIARESKSSKLTTLLFITAKGKGESSRLKVTLQGYLCWNLGSVLHGLVCRAEWLTANEGERSRPAITNQDHSHTAKLLHNKLARQFIAL